MEEWKQTRFDNYMMSVDGEVMSLNYNKTGKHKILKLHKGKRGYCYFTVYINGKPKTISVHRLLWETFIGEIPDGMVIDHCDGNPQNNRLDNLRCVSQKENINNPNTKPRLVEANRNKSQEWRKKNTEAVRKANNKPIAQINKQTGKIIKLWECARDVERELGINNGHISACCNTKRKSAGGFKWKFCSK